MNILILCTYPINSPRHGGQLRVRNIVDSYRLAGHRVDVVGVLGSHEYENENGFLPFPGEVAISNYIKNPYLMEDYAIGRLFSEEDNHYDLLAKKIINKPEVIQIEHPWLFSFAKKYINEKKIHPLFIYSSHNIEWKLKKDIISSAMGDEVGLEYSEKIRVVEEEAISASQLISSVSENDSDWIKTITDKKVVVAPNGVSAWSLTEKGAREALTISENYRYALYCASAHPPNITGFFDIFSGGFGSLRPDEKLIIAGGAGWNIASDIRIHQSAILAEKTKVAGVVSLSCLHGLLSGAHCIVLPITQGGGTNLKTAEALWSGKHVLATSVAMRGFERFIDTPGVYIADSPIKFKQDLRRIMNMPPLRLSKVDQEERSTVLWETCLKSLVNEVNLLESKA